MSVAKASLAGKGERGGPKVCFGGLTFRGGPYEDNGGPYAGGGGTSGGGGGYTGVGP